jgi:hypothetical protein
MAVDRGLPQLPVHARLPGDAASEPSRLRWTKAALTGDTPALQTTAVGVIELGGIEAVYVPFTGSKLVYSRAVRLLGVLEGFGDGTGASLTHYQSAHCAYRKSNGGLGLAVQLLGGIWNKTSVFDAYSTTHTPAITAFPTKSSENTLVCVFRGPDGVLQHTVRSSQNWSPARPLRDLRTSHAPALAVHEDRVYCAFRTDDGRVSYCNDHSGRGPDDPVGWSAEAVIPGVETTHGPALASYDGQLWCAYRGLDGRYRAVSYASDTWSTPVVLSDRLTAFGPAMAPKNLNWVV